MKAKLLFTALALGAAVFTAQGQNTLSIGNYDDYEAEEYNEPTNPYDGSGWEISPINFYYTNSGTQILLKADELADMAGKNITKLAFKYYCEGAYIQPEADVKIWITETDDDAFYYDTTEKRYKYFAVDTDNPIYDGSISIDGNSYDYSVGPELEFTFDQAYYYQGDKNLVITITTEGTTETADGAFYINFGQSDLSKRALTFANDKATLSETLSGDLWADRYSVSVINAPDMQFTYEDAEAPTPAITFDDNSQNAGIVDSNNGQVVDATVDRTMEAEKWNTIFLPFSLTAAQVTEIFGEGTTLAEYQSFDTDKRDFQFVSVSTVEANTPLLVKPTKAVNGFTATGVTIVKGAADPATEIIIVPTAPGFHGLLDKKAIAGAFNTYYLSTNGKIRQIQSGTLHALRCYFTTDPETGDGGEEQAANTFSIDGEPTGIVMVETGKQSFVDAPAYNLAGQRVDNSYKGVVIVGGKKIIRK